MPAAAFHSIAISPVITHRLSAALAMRLFYIFSLALQSVSPPTCKQMEMSYGLTFFPYGFVSPACQANGKQISQGPTADCSSEKEEEEKRKTHTRTRNEITNISVAWLWNATTEVLQQHR